MFIGEIMNHLYRRLILRFSERELGTKWIAVLIFLPNSLPGTSALGFYHVIIIQVFIAKNDRSW